MQDVQQNPNGEEEQDMGVFEGAEYPAELDVSGEEENTIWDNMVQALKPDLRPMGKRGR
jgi:hypothetical protein